MDVIIDQNSDPAVLRLDTPEDTRSFQVVLLSPAPQATFPSGIRHEEFFWVSLAVLRELAAGRVADTWSEEFAAMVQFATSKGWYDEETDSIRGHVVHAHGE